LVLICGLTGSGKSTLARDLSRRLGLKAISSDVTRKRLAGISGDRDAAPFEQGIYSPVMTQRTYAAMAEEAETLLRSGQGAILDATFHRREQRQRFFDLAGRYGVPFAVVSLEPPDEIARGRLERRGVEGSDISDGRWEIYLEQRKRSEPLTDVSPRLRLVVDTTSPPEALLRGVEGFLRSVLSHRES
jgi:predicted kinase